jgi:hypothetical protein
MTARKLKSLKISEALEKAMAQLAKEDRTRVVHVIPERNRWVVKREQAQRALRVLSKKSEAIELARSLARRLNGEVMIHREDARIQDWEIVQDGQLRTVYRHDET